MNTRWQLLVVLPIVVGAAASAQRQPGFPAGPTTALHPPHGLEDPPSLVCPGSRVRGNAGSTLVASRLRQPMLAAAAGGHSRERPDADRRPDAQPARGGLHETLARRLQAQAQAGLASLRRDLRRLDEAIHHGATALRLALLRRILELLLHHTMGQRLACRLCSLLVIRCSAGSRLVRFAGIDLAEDPFDRIGPIEETRTESVAAHGAQPRIAARSRPPTG